MSVQPGPLTSFSSAAAGAARTPSPTASTSTAKSLRILSPFLAQLEVGVVVHAVRQRDVQDVAAGRAGRVPVVDELIRAGVVAQNRSACGRRLERVGRVAAEVAAGDR